MFFNGKIDKENEIIYLSGTAVRRKEILPFATTCMKILYGTT